MNKLFTKIAALALGAAMVVGVGVSVSSFSKTITEANAEPVQVDITSPSGTQASSCLVQTAGGTNMDTVSTYGAVKLGKSGGGGNFNISVGANANKLTLYSACWKAKSPTLSLTSSGVTFTPSSVSLAANDGVANNSPFKLSGITNTSDTTYKFEFTMAGVGSNGATVNIATSNERAVIWNITYEVTSSEDTYYTVTYDVNHDSLPTTSESIIEDGNPSFTAPSAYAGHKFLGWKTTGDNTLYTTANKTDFTVTQDVTFTAQWTDAFEVTYNANSGSGTMTDPNSPYVSGSNVTILSNSFGAPLGAQFVKWNTETDGSGQDYNPGDSVSNIQSNLSLYAIWETPSSGATDSTKYEKVSSTGDLEVGKSYLISAEVSGTNYFMASVTRNNNKSAVEKTADSNNQVTRGSDALSFILLNSSTQGKYYLFSENYESNGYASSCTSGDSNHFNIGTTPRDVSISISNGVASVTIAPHSSRYNLYFNSSNNPKIFACYGDQGSYKSVSLWKQVVEDTVDSINIAATSGSGTDATSGEVECTKQLQLYCTAHYNTAGLVDVTQDATWTAVAGTGSASVSNGLITGGNAGTVTINVSFAGKSDSFSLTVKVGPTISTNPASTKQILVNETNNTAIQVTTANFSDTPTLSVTSADPTKLTASIYTNDNKDYVALTAGEVSEDTTINVTVSATLGQRVESHTVAVTIKAMVVSLSTDSITLLPTSGATEYGLTVSNFKSGYTVSAESSNSSAFTASVSQDQTKVIVTPSAEGSGNLTITVSNGSGQSVERSKTIVIPVSIEDVEVYEKVTDATKLTAGSKILLVYETGSVAMSEQSGSIRTKTSVTIASSKITGPSSDVKPITLEDAGDGKWYLKVSDGYLTYSGSANEIYTTDSEPSGNSFKWSISISSGNATIESVNVSGRQIRYNSGSPRFACYAGTQQAIQIYGILVPDKEIVNSKMTVGTVSASTNDTSWTVDNFQFEVLYEGDSNYTDVTSSTTFSVAEPIPTISADGTMPVTVTPIYGGVTYTAKAAEVTATLNYINFYSIERLYDIELDPNESSSSQLTFDGIYLGYTTHVSSNVTYYDIYVGNGDYGMYVYGLSSVSGWTAGSTKLTVTGYMKNFSGLYEFTKVNNVSPSVSILSDSDRISHIITPTTYIVTGSAAESTNFKLASRKTSLSGQITSVNNVTTAGTKPTADQDNTILVSVGGNNVTLYLKKAQATSEVVNELSVGSTVTVSGFSSYHNGFQVYLSEIVEAGDYHAADFAKDLLKLTREICSEADEGNGSALASVWLTLNSSDYWLKIKAAGEDSTFTNGTPDYDIEVPNTAAGIDAMSDSDAIAAAIARYDWCTAKYKLTNFMERTLTVSFDRVVLNPLATVEGNPTTVIILISVIGVSALGGFFFLRKRKEI